MFKRTKKNQYLHHKRSVSLDLRRTDPIERDRELNSLIDQWIGGQISYEEMKCKHRRADNPITKTS